MPKMKRASYREAVAWIARNVQPMHDNELIVLKSDATGVVAHIFGVDVERVTDDVYEFRFLSRFPGGRWIRK